MPQEMVFSIFPDGTIQHTLKDDFLRPLGERSIERVSDIRHSEQFQRFYVFWLRGTYAGHVLNTTQWISQTGGRKPPGEVLITNGILMFATYDQAVEAEVLMLNAMRLNGERF